MRVHTPFRYGIDTLDATTALALAQGLRHGVIDDQAKEKIVKSYSDVAEMAQGSASVYGINTGFGPLCTTKIAPKDTLALQRNILMSHAVGVGKPIDRSLSALMMVLKIHALAQGYSGISLTTLERIIKMLDCGLIPVVPSQGSVGASGDLAPLSHLFLPLIGLGELWSEEKIVPAAPLLEQQGFGPLTLGPKEGLALINGTQFILAHAVQVLAQFQKCLDQADLSAALMVEALQGSAKPFDRELHLLRPFAGCMHVAERMRQFLGDSDIMKDHEHCDRVQDPYSLRCVPQVHGASRNAWLHLKELVHIELNAITDNPVVLGENNAISGGHFHGQPLAMALDYAALALAELGNISDRRIYLALEGKSAGVPKLLMEDTGIHSGYMILQYTTAALASENKSLCFPASADSIPTSLGQEDHVSMGSISGRKALQISDNVLRILSIEVLTAAQALTFRRPLASGVLLDAVYQKIRSEISFAPKDRIFYHDIEKATQWVSEGILLNTVKNEAALQGISLKTAFSEQFDQY